MHFTMKTFRIDADSWMTPAILGLVVYLFSIVFNHHFYKIHLYLIIAGVITFLISFSKYATADKTNLNLFYGIPIFRRKLTLSWDEIKFVEPQRTEKRGFVSAGPRGGAPFTYREFSIKLHLNKKLPNQIQSSLKLQRKFQLFKEGPEVTDDGLGIVIRDSPKCGFGYFLSVLADYTRVEGFESPKGLSRIDKVALNYSQAIVLFLILMYFFFFTYQNIS